MLHLANDREGSEDEGEFFIRRALDTRKINCNMKIIFLFTLILISSLSYAQNKFKVEPFIIKGQLTHCPEKYLILYYEDVDCLQLSDTIKLDQDGKFFFKSYKILNPQRISIQKNNIQINNLIVAPGYDLTLAGDAPDFITLAKSKKISGVGAQGNQYRFILDSISIARNIQGNYFQLKENDFKIFLRENSFLQDSIIEKVFGNKKIREKHFSYVKNMIKVDNKFEKLSSTLSYIKFRLGYSKSQTFLNEIFNQEILKDLYNDDYLESYSFKNYVISNAYVDFLVDLDYLKDSTLRNQKNYRLEKVENVYTGKVKEYVLQKLIKNYIVYSQTYIDLNSNKDLIEPYLTSIKNVRCKTNLNSIFAEKEKDSFKTQLGKPAPGFTLQDNLGTSVSLNDFKGKVVYIDVWASWCGPCRDETPALKLLYEKYKNDSRVAFISVAVRDVFKDWKKALEEDKPEWIQLIDKEDVVWKSYTAYSIPNFVLIDKAGNILNIDAPRPSSGIEIEKLIDSAILK